MDEDTSHSKGPSRGTPDLRIAEDERLNPVPNQPMTLMTPASMTNTTITPGTEFLEVPTDGQFSWPEDFSDPTFDWFAWFNQQIS